MFVLQDQQGRGKGGEMTQTLNAHMNKIKIKKKQGLEMTQVVVPT
jgi:hypothetical protein